MGVTKTFLPFWLFFVIFKAEGYLLSNSSEIIVDFNETILSSPELTNFGSWGFVEICSGGSYAIGAQVKMELPNRPVDNTALNGIRLFCASDPSDQISDIQENITSSVGRFGDWGEKLQCETGFITGFQLESQSYQGIKKDDVAATNIKIICGKLHAEGFEAFDYKKPANDTSSSYYPDSGYTEPQFCPRQTAVCGIQTQVEFFQTLGDDTALNNVNMICCPIEDISN